MFEKFPIGIRKSVAVSVALAMFSVANASLAEATVTFDGTCASWDNGINDKQGMLNILRQKLGRSSIEANTELKNMTPSGTICGSTNNQGISAIIEANPKSSNNDKSSFTGCVDAANGYTNLINELSKNNVRLSSVIDSFKSQTGSTLFDAVNAKRLAAVCVDAVGGITFIMSDQTVGSIDDSATRTTVSTSGRTSATTKPVTSTPLASKPNGDKTKKNICDEYAGEGVVVYTVDAPLGINTKFKTFSGNPCVKSVSRKLNGDNFITGPFKNLFKNEELRLVDFVKGHPECDGLLYTSSEDSKIVISMDANYGSYILNNGKCKS